MSHLERFFTPRSAKAVEKALGAMGQQVAQEEEAQGHRVSPGLAALQRGACQCVDAEVNVHMHMWAVSYRPHHTACTMPLISATEYGTAARECLPCSDAPVIKFRQWLCKSHAQAPWAFVTVHMISMSTWLYSKLVCWEQFLTNACDCTVGDLISSHDAPGVLKEVVHLLNLSHADSNDLPLAAHQPGVPAWYHGGTENPPKGYQGIAEASPGGFPLTQQGMLNSPRLLEHAALSPVEQALYQSQHSGPELPDLLRGPSTEPQHSQRESYEYSQSHRAGSVYSMGTAHDFASAQSHDLQYPLMHNSGESGFGSSMDPESISQHTGETAQGSFADAQRRSGQSVHRTSADPQHAQRQSGEFVHRPSADPQHAQRQSGEFVHRSSADPQHAQRRSDQFVHRPSADPQHAQRQSGELVHRSSADPQQAQQQPRELVRCVSKEQLARQQATYWSTWHPHAEDDKRLQRRYLSMWLQVTAVNFMCLDTCITQP